MNSACDIVCHIGENVNHTHQTNIYMAWTGHINASYPNVTMIRYLHLHGSCVYVIHRAPKLISAHERERKMVPLSQVALSN